MVRSETRAVAVFVLALVTAIPALGQRQKEPAASHYGPCGAPSGGAPNSTSYYGHGDPCAYTYSVPADRINDLLNDVSYCTM